MTVVLGSMILKLYNLICKPRTRSSRPPLFMIPDQDPIKGRSGALQGLIASPGNAFLRNAGNCMEVTVKGGQPETYNSSSKSI